MTSRMTIKLPTKKVIELLQAKLAERETWAANYDKLAAAEKKDHEAWELRALAHAHSNPKKAINRTAEYAYTNDYVRIIYTFKMEHLPPKPEKTITHLNNPHNYGYQEETKDLKESIRLLTLAEENGQETISTGTYRNLTRWL